MKKQIKQYGNSLVIKITAEDQEIYGLEAGDIIDIELVKIDEPTRSRRK
jgi:antitoxin component of MazEF toxin-antitoxin module